MTGGAFAGAVLCGGASRRMGTDKSLLELGGQALAARVAHALRAAGADPVVAIGGDAAALGDLGLAVVADEHPGEGPLGAVITALGALGDEAELVAVLACDLVDADPATIRAVVDHARTHDVDVAAPYVDGWCHLHHGVWNVRALTPLREAFAAGERAPRRAVGSLRVGEVRGIAEWRVRDADDPAELAAARAALAARPPDHPAG
jgi:molybdopterin-guanine dinucleotide biosynthesis protein A